MIKEIINEFNPMSISIEINKHKEYYESVVSFLDEKQLKYISKDILDEMINRNTIVNVCCYPFYDIFHYDLDIALELMYNALKDE